jgi:hypothetical protein
MARTEVSGADAGTGIGVEGASALPQAIGMHRNVTTAGIRSFLIVDNTVGLMFISYYPGAFSLSSVANNMQTNARGASQLHSGNLF